MKVYDAYRMAVEAGMSKDIRPDRELQKVLSDAREAYEKTDADRKDLFDSERLWNPYSDTRFSVLSDEAGDIEAETMMWGVDIGSAEVLLADRLRDTKAFLGIVTDIFCKLCSLAPITTSLSSFTFLLLSINLLPSYSK